MLIESEHSMARVDKDGSGVEIKVMATFARLFVRFFGKSKMRRESFVRSSFSYLSSVLKPDCSKWWSLVRPCVILCCCITTKEMQPVRVQPWSGRSAYNSGPDQKVFGLVGPTAEPSR
jgi:hypothetical protein